MTRRQGLSTRPAPSLTNLVSLTSGLLDYQLFQQVGSPLFEWAQVCPHAHTPYGWVSVWHPTHREEHRAWAAGAPLLWVHVYLEVSSCNCRAKVQTWGHKSEPSAELIQGGTVQKVSIEAKWGSCPHICPLRISFPPASSTFC